MDDITKQITAVMQQYSENVKSDVESVLKEVGDEAKRKVKSASPRRTGKYQRGWRVDFQSKGSQITVTVHQKSPTYRLTHLLEDGHRSRSGSRVKAQPHIREVEQWAEREALKEIEKAVKG